MAWRPWAALVLLATAGCAGPPAAVDAVEAREPEKDPANFSWVRKGALAIGGGGLTSDDVAYLDSQGFDAVASFRAEHEDPAQDMRERGIEFLYLPIVHGTQIDVQELRTFVEWQLRMEQEGRRTYAHCTNGWHRAAAFAVAYELKTTERTFDELQTQAAARRPGTVMRAIGALLEYESEVRGRPPLYVSLTAERPRPEPGEGLPVRVEVLDPQGRPVEGASVVFWNEEGGPSIEGTTASDGTFWTEYVPAPGDHSMNHLYARVRHADFGDGGDAQEVFLDRPPRGPAPIEVLPALEAGGLRLELVRGDGSHTRGRFHVFGSEGFYASARTDDGHAFVPIPAGQSVLQVRAEAWGSQSEELRVAAR